MIKLLIYTILLVMLFAESNGQTLGFSIADGRKKVDIPIEIQNNLIIVPVILNNKLPLKFIVDTGVRTAILTQKIFSDILQLPYSRKYTIAGPGGIKLIDAYVTNNVSIDLPGVTGKGHALLVLEEDYLELRNYLGTDVHGILGYELFSRFIVKIDYEKKIMTLSTPDTFHPPKKFRELPMVIEDTKPFILTAVNLTPSNIMSSKLLVDTGASHALMLEPTSDNRIIVPHNTVSAVLGRGLGGVIMGKTGRIESLELANYTLHKVLVNFPDSNSYLDTLKRSLTFRHGSIGGDVLCRFTVIFNFAQGKLYLKKNAQFKRDFYLNLSGLELKAKGAALNVFEIIDVRRLSPASKAGVLQGDVLISINGMATKSIQLNHINALLNSVPGRKVTLEIERNQIKQKVSFKLESQL